jgi:hypothetical protein
MVLLACGAMAHGQAPAHTEEFTMRLPVAGSGISPIAEQRPLFLANQIAAPTRVPFLPRVPSLLYSRTHCQCYSAQAFGLNFDATNAAAAIQPDIVWDDIQIPLPAAGGATSVAVDRITMYWGRLGTDITPACQFTLYRTNLDLSNLPANVTPISSPSDTPAAAFQTIGVGNYGQGNTFTGGGIAGRVFTVGADGGATIFTQPLNVSYAFAADGVTPIGAYGSFAIGAQVAFPTAANPLNPANWTYTRWIISDNIASNTFTGASTAGASQFSEDAFWIYDTDVTPSEQAWRYNVPLPTNSSTMIEIHGQLVVDAAPVACCIIPTTGATPLCITVGAAEQCVQSGGTASASASCNPSPCITGAQGACCNTATGTCAQSTAASCTSGYQGDNTTCPAGGCAVTSVCCDSITGVCSLVYGGGACTTGTAGTGTACTAGACPANGACCSGTACVLSLPTNCAGTYNGNNTGCVPNSCFPADECETTTWLAHVGANAQDSTGASTSAHLTVNTCGAFTQSRGSNDVFFWFTAPATNSYTIDTCGASFDTVISLHDGCPTGDTNLLACNDDTAALLCGDGTSTPGANDSMIEGFSMTAGNLYYIRVAGFGDPGPTGAFTLNITYVNPIGSCCDATTCLLSDQGNCTLTTWTLGGTCSPNPCAPAGGICCRGSTCTNTLTTAANCTASVVSGSTAGAAFVAATSTCNSGAISSGPCCYANYNKVGGITVQDIFDFLNDWFAGRPYAKVGGDGIAGPLAVQNIFDFLTDWFNGGCS